MLTALLRFGGVLRPALALTLLVAVSALRAYAGTDLTLAPSITVAPGGTGVLSGTLTNTGPGTVYYNSLNYSFLSAPSGAITDPKDPNVALLVGFDTDAPFFQNETMDKDNPFTGNLFDVFADSGAPYGDYTLRITLLGGANPFFSPNPSSDVLASYDVNTSIAPVPELGTNIIFGLTLLGLVGCRLGVRCKQAKMS